LKVQLLDLASQYRRIRKEVLEEVRKVCDSQHYILGKNVSGFERDMASYCGARFGVGVASGTDAVLLSLMAMGVGAGDRVITTPFTFFSTVSSIARLGAVPVFADIDPLTYNLDPESLERLCRSSRGRGAKAVIPVHLFGQCADMAPINRVARKYGLKVVEDAAQSVGALYRGSKAGSLSDAGCFSFYPTKNLGGFGDGGMVTTGSVRTARRLRMLRGHGSRVRYYHELIGINSRLDELQAAVLRVKLRYLEQWTEGRINNAARYDSLFDKAGLGSFVKTPYIRDKNRSVFNQYVVRVKRRNALREHLARMGIGTEIYYPLPVHLQRCFKYLGCKRGDYPVSEKAAKEVLALPIYPELDSGKQRQVVAGIAGFYERFG